MGAAFCWFQAEDGIRDYKVTGVQTCALPICGITVEPVHFETVNETLSATGELTVNEDRTWIVGSHIEGRVVSVHRSEERRVGKEGRSGGGSRREHPRERTAGERARELREREV